MFLYLSDHSDLLSSFILAAIIVGILAKPLKTSVLDVDFTVLIMKFARENLEHLHLKLP